MREGWAAHDQRTEILGLRRSVGLSPGGWAGLGGTASSLAGRGLVGGGPGRSSSSESLPSLSRSSFSNDAEDSRNLLCREVTIVVQVDCGDLGRRWPLRFWPPRLAPAGLSSGEDCRPRLVADEPSSGEDCHLRGAGEAASHRS